MGDGTWQRMIDSLVKFRAQGVFRMTVQRCILRKSKYSTADYPNLSKIERRETIAYSSDGA